MENCGRLVLATCALMLGEDGVFPCAAAGSAMDFFIDLQICNGRALFSLVDSILTWFCLYGPDPGLFVLCIPIIVVVEANIFESILVFRHKSWSGTPASRRRIRTPSRLRSPKRPLESLLSLKTC